MRSIQAVRDEQSIEQCVCETAGSDHVVAEHRLNGPVCAFHRGMLEQSVALNADRPPLLIIGGGGLARHLPPPPPPPPKPALDKFLPPSPPTPEKHPAPRPPPPAPPIP